MRNLACILFTLIVLCVANPARAELRLANIFNDHMVLQQECRTAWYEALSGRYDDMLDRTIRQGSFDAAKSEMELYGNATEILRRKADRIADILGEMNPEFYRNDNLRKLNLLDWTIRRCNEARLGKAAQVPDQMVELMKDNRLREKVEKLRQALDEYRRAVEQLEGDR